MSVHCFLWCTMINVVGVSHKKDLEDHIKSWHQSINKLTAGLSRALRYRLLRQCVSYILYLDFSFKCLCLIIFELRELIHDKHLCIMVLREACLIITISDNIHMFQMTDPIRSLLTHQPTQNLHYQHQ